MFFLPFMQACCIVAAPREQAPKYVRAEEWVQAHFPQLSRRQAREALAGELVRKSGTALRKGDRVAPNATLDTKGLETHLIRLGQGNAEVVLDVLYESTDFAVVDKPAGTHGHPLSLWDDATVTHWALHRYPELREALRDKAQPCLTPHRLDIGTTGALIVCRTKANYELWRGRFSRHEVTKQYLAWCWGSPKKLKFEINLGIGHDPSVPSRMLPDTEPKLRPPILPASTSVSVLETREGFFLCRATTRTGVTHQVRVHLSALGFPLLGDALYDATFAKRPLKPLWPQLRASEINHPNFCLQTPSERFITSL
ncbi:MAG: RluA family pseudouridine synthase [Bdellovibrionales bacterium]|nr:RluA family pseudouridine synthase [Bdellovibrionales bacterium]